MNENCKNSQSTANLRWFRHKLPASESTSHMRSDSGSVVTRIVANPCEIKTQVAKITLNSEHSKSPTLLLTSSSNQQTQETFEQKRQERAREVEEITNQLKEIGLTALIPFEGSVNAKNIEFKLPYGIEIDRVSTASSTYRRCKTEGAIISRPKSATTRTESSFQLDTLRNGPVSTRRTELVKSHENLLTDSAASKRRSYDPIEARRFMKEQKKKRRAISTSNAEQKVALEKEQIKKRLEELRKSSRMIITKNLKKNRAQNANPTKPTKLTSPKKSPSKVPSKANVVNRSVFSGNVDFLKKKTEGMVNKSVEIDIAKSKDSIETELSAKSDRSDVSQKVKSQRQGLEIKMPSSGGIIENQRRVGLLRKPEIKDHSFSAIKDFSFDKENVALEMLTPKIPSLAIDGVESHDSRKSNNSTRSNEKSKLPENLQLQETPIKSTRDSNVALKSAEKQQTEELIREEAKNVAPELSKKLQSQEFPNAHEPPERQCEKSTQVRNNPSLHIDMFEQPEMPKQTSDLPYWLRPSAVQIYPYNFIQAVRRKIESIVEPATNVAVELPMNKNNMTPTNDSPPKDLKKANTLLTVQTTKAPFMTPKNIAVAAEPAPKEKNSMVELPKSEKNSQENVHKPQTPSDFNSNFNSNLSSISLQMPISNTVSEVSSLKSESILSMHRKTHSKSKHKGNVDQDDDTTVSSSIFSSPEKRRHTQTSSKKCKENAVEPKTVSPLSLENVEKFKIISKHKNNEQNKQDKAAITTTTTTTNSNDVDFNKLLSDFNHGLSQVIEANEQLKSTLDRSQQILSPSNDSRRQNSVVATHEEYTTDFEDSSHANSNKTTSSFSQQSEGRSKNEHQNKRKRKLFQVATPLLSSPKFDFDNKSSHVTSSNTLSGPEFELNLNSITPTSVHTSESANSTTTSGSRSVKYQWETIEQLTPISEPVSPHGYEERLATIDQLKDNLRRMINDSKVQRRADRLESASTETNKSTSLKNNSHGSHKTILVRHSKKSKSISPNTPQSSQLTASTDATSKTASTESSNTNHSNDNSAALSTTFDILPLESYAVRNAQGSCSRSSSSKATNRKQKRTSESSSRIITEDLQKTYESSSKENKAENSRWSRSHYAKHDHESFIHSHINVSRGEYSPENDRLHRTTALQEDRNSPVLPGYSAEYPATVKKTKSPSSVKTVTTTTTTTSRKSINSQVITRLRISDLEISHISSCDGSISESSLNYSNVGLYEQLIKNETTKSEYLTTLLKMREKAILDRTKGQIAWLEVQKERYKSKGLMIQIAAIRKKQRAILMKMEREREDIKRILQNTQSRSSNQASSRLKSGCEKSDLSEQRNPRSPPHHTPPALLPETQPLQHHRRHHHHRREHSYDSLIVKPSSAPILRANYELETSASLEELLRQREEDLRKRREYVERLMEWHRKLDQEEAEVLNLERMLFTYNANLAEPYRSGSSATTTRQLEASVSLNKTTEHAELAKRAHEMERRLKEIDKSLRELNNISATTTPLPNNCNAPTAVNGQDVVSSEDNLDFVRTTGSKLNKLWRRLTSQHVEKFEPNRRYKLCKSDLERLYEEAKRAVLSDFAQAEERSLAAELLDKSMSNVSGGQSQASYSSIGSAGDIINVINAENSNNIDATNTEVFNSIPVPNLNLNFSTSQSEEQEDEHIASNSISTTKTYSLSKRCTRTGDYSPSAAEKNFQTQSSTSTPSPTKFDTTSPTTNKERSELMKRNMRKFLRLTNQTPKLNQNNEGLERSLSDTQLASSSKSDNRINGASKCCLWAAHQNENKFNLHTPKKESPSTHSSKYNDISTNPKTTSSSSTPSHKTIASSIVETVNIPSYSVSLASPTDRNSNETSPLYSAAERRLANTYEMNDSSDDEQILTAQTISRATVIRSINSQSASYSWGTEVTNNPTNSSKSVKTSREVENTSISTEQEAMPSDFECKSNEIATKLNKISEAVARLSRSDSLVSQKSTNSADHLVETIADDETLSNATKSLLPITSNKHQSEQNNNSDISYTLSFESPDATAITSQTPKTQGRLTSSGADISPLSQSELENRLLDEYELEFDCSNNDTLLDDVSMPRLDNTFDTTATSQVSEEVCDPVIEVQKSNSPEDLCAEEIQKEATMPTTASCESSPAKTTQSVKTLNSIESSNNSDSNSTQQSLQQQLMPDIINELEIRRCQQILLESEQFRQHEHVTAVPYMYVREIPNKPPPPYCPPAHGSPMTTIFPSEERIKDITYRRTHELYCEILKTDHVNEKGEKLPSVLDEQITNIYERIILDICREYLHEHHEVLAQGDPANFRSQLAFFNPPDRLRCIQESIYKEVRRCLAMDKTSPKRTPVYSIYGHRAKRDHIGKIIIQEMYEEDDKWCNFYHEEEEVLELIIEEMIGNDICEIAKVVFLEEGGCLLPDETAGTIEVLQIDQSLEISQNAEIEIEATTAITIDETTCGSENGNETVNLESSSNEELKV